jgi:hypothetical protein
MAPQLGPQKPFLKAQLGVVRGLLPHDHSERGDRPEPWEQVEDLVALYLAGSDRDKLEEFR